ncbi:hypothetical protein EVAR_49891_1 [Eumeta japonica]|uniref:Uncharacterized protein n=1 Tax=Eumeta variegata TaxID=151549 RepID=A0A4C1Y524_EUMVA|nr:hypothetical protein EVAR_49891_1 [Eumeta japonica]
MLMVYIPAVCIPLFSAIMEKAYASARRVRLGAGRPRAAGRRRGRVLFTLAATFECGVLVNGRIYGRGNDALRKIYERRREAPTYGTRAIKPARNRTREPLESKWSSPSMDTHDPTDATSALAPS